jgi:hypothetical protein
MLVIFVCFIPRIICSVNLFCISPGFSSDIIRIKKGKSSPSQKISIVLVIFVCFIERIICSVNLLSISPGFSSDIISRKKANYLNSAYEIINMA